MSDINDSSPLKDIGSLFSKTDKPARRSHRQAEEKSNSKRGPKKRLKKIKPTTVRFREDQLSWLDDFAYRIKKKGAGSWASQSAVMRAIVDLLQAASINDHLIEDEFELKERLLDGFKKLDKSDIT